MLLISRCQNLKLQGTWHSPNTSITSRPVGKSVDSIFEWFVAHNGENITYYSNIELPLGNGMWKNMSTGYGIILVSDKHYVTDILLKVALNVNNINHYLLNVIWIANYFILKYLNEMTINLQLP